MNCERTQNLIMTDYSDGQLSAGRRRQVEAHLRNCAVCRGLAQRIMSEGMLPFHQAAPARCDEFVWLRIKQRLQQQETVRTGVSRLDILDNFFYPFRPLALAVSLLFVAVITPVIYSNFTPHTSYLSYVLDTDSGGDDIASGVEQYFL